MTPRMRPLALIAGVLAVTALVSPVVVRAAGTPAPAVSFTDMTGTTVALSSLKGQVVLLDFWASWCIPCRRSFPEVDAMQQSLRGRGVVAYAIGVDEDAKQARAFLAEHPHTIPVALDPKGTLAAAFKLTAMPTSIILDREGRIRFTHQGYTEKTIAQFRAEVQQLLAEGGAQ
mgnify:CR=1 FL=1